MIIQYPFGRLTLLYTWESIKYLGTYLNSYY